MAEHEGTIEIEAAEAIHDVQIAVADAGGDSADQDLAAARLIHVDGFDGQRLVHFAEHGGGDLHGYPPSSGTA